VLDATGQETFVVDEQSGVADIGNGAISATILPGVHATDDGVLTDCPGLFDTRAPAVNVANGINVAACAEAASDSKFVLLIEYGSATGARGNAVKDVFLALVESLGGIKGLIAHASSIQLLVSKAPLDYDLQYARKLLNKTAAVLREDERAVARELFGRAELYHPLDQGHKSWIKHSDLKSKIEALIPIPRPGNVYRSPLSSPDEKLLRDITNAKVKAVTDGLKDSNFRACAEALADLERLNVVNLRIVHVLVAGALSNVHALVERLFREAQLFLLNDRFDDASQIASQLKALEAELRRSNSSMSSAIAGDLARSLGLRVGDLTKLIEHRRLEEKRFAQAQLEQKAQSEQTKLLEEKLAKLESINRGLKSDLEAVQNELVQAQKASKDKARQLEATFMEKINAMKERAARGEKEKESTAEAEKLEEEMNIALKALNKEAAAKEEAIKRSIQEQKALAQKKAEEEATLRRDLESAEAKRRRESMDTRQAAEAAATVEAAERKAEEAARQAREAAAAAQANPLLASAVQHTSEDTESEETPSAIRAEGEAWVRDLVAKHDANLNALSAAAEAQASTREAHLTQALQSLDASLQNAIDASDIKKAKEITAQVDEKKASAAKAGAIANQELVAAKASAIVAHDRAVENIERLYEPRAAILEELIAARAALATAKTMETNKLNVFKAAAQARVAKLEADAEKKLAEFKISMKAKDFDNAEKLKGEADKLKAEATSAAVWEKDAGNEERTKMEAEAKALKKAVADETSKVKRLEEEFALLPKTLAALDRLQPLFDDRTAMLSEVTNNFVSGDSQAMGKQLGELLKLPWSRRAVALGLTASEVSAAEAPVLDAAVQFAGSKLPGLAHSELDPKPGTNNCTACGVKLSGFKYSMLVATKRRCRSCGHVICGACSPTKVEVSGYETPQRVCTPCVKARATKEGELKAAAAEAEKRCAEARTAAQRAASDDTASAPELQEGSAASILASAAKRATAAGKQEVAAALQEKLNEVSNKCFVLAVALHAFPVNTIVRSSVAGANRVAAGTAGEVIGHTSDGKVEVRFKEGEEAIFEVAMLRLAVDLPNGWAVNQTCFALVKLSDEISTGQSGRVLGWSKPFDSDKIMAQFGDIQVNVLLGQLETEIERRKRLIRFAIARIVEASKGQLNWALELPKASWNHVKEVAGSFEVRLGVNGDNKCGFSFATEITLSDLALIFGTTNLTVLDVNNQQCSGRKVSF